MNRRQFSLTTLMLVTTCAAVFFGVNTHFARKRAATIATYNAQKKVVDQAIVMFADTLASEGWTISNDSTGIGGSGEWRTFAAFTCSKPGKPILICYVEIMGFVSHNATDTPTWLTILPMRLSARGNALETRFLGFLGAILESRDWLYTIESQVRDVDAPGVPSHYETQNAG